MLWKAMKWVLSKAVDKAADSVLVAVMGFIPWLLSSPVWGGWRRHSRGRWYGNGYLVRHHHLQ